MLEDYTEMMYLRDIEKVAEILFPENKFKGSIFQKYGKMGAIYKDYQNIKSIEAYLPLLINNDPLNESKIRERVARITLDSSGFKYKNNLWGNFHNNYVQNFNKLTKHLEEAKTIENLIGSDIFIDSYIRSLAYRILFPIYKKEAVIEDFMKYLKVFEKTYDILKLSGPIKRSKITMGLFDIIYQWYNKSSDDHWNLISTSLKSNKIVKVR